MKIPLSWLKEHIQFSIDPKEIGEILTSAGIEVDELRSLSPSFSGVVVGQVLEVEKHPNADRLRVATVSDGQETFQVVCGAPNCRPGILTALAKIGARLTSEDQKPFTIKKGKLRDVESHGMLCSLQELSLGSEREKIAEFPEGTVVGSDIASLYTDTIFVISLTPNLGHCMSIRGIARELSSLLHLPLIEQSIHLTESENPTEDLIKVHLLDQRQCPRYACKVVQNITVEPSPEWLRKKIEGSGLRSINNVVDVGNLVLLEYGQPLHIFDYDLIDGKEIFITSQTPHKELETLDGVIRPIPQGSLLICDQTKPLAFAGVIGGKSSSVHQGTKNVCIEAAYFIPQAVRKTGRVIGCTSDSSQRFERGVDPNGPILALRYAAHLLQKIAGGSVSKGEINLQSHEFKEKVISCHPSRVNQLLGTQLSLSEIAALFRSAYIQILEERPHELLLCVPTYRHDLLIEEDLIEEVARLYGYSNIPEVTPKHISSQIPHTPIYLLEKKVRALLVGQGLREIITCDLLHPEQAAISLQNTISSDSLISVLHPSSIDQSVLRASLLPGLLQVVKYNCDHTNPNIAAFEVGKIHFKTKTNCTQYAEPFSVGIVLTGLRVTKQWNSKEEPFDFFDIKGVIQNLFRGLNINTLSFETSHLHQLHPGRQAHIKINEVLVGVIGEVHPDLVEKIDLPNKVYCAEINLSELLFLVPKWETVVESSPFPGSERDWTISLSEEIPIGKVYDAISQIPSRLLERFALLDLYKSDQIGKDKKNATFRFFYKDLEKTISFESVEREHARITQAVAEKLTPR